MGKINAEKIDRSRIPDSEFGEGNGGDYGEHEKYKGNDDDAFKERYRHRKKPEKQQELHGKNDIAKKTQPKHVCHIPGTEF
jgi:hypothetical protein